MSDATQTGFHTSVELPNQFSGREVPVELHGSWTPSGLRLHISGLDLRNFEAVVGPQQAQEYRDFVATRCTQPAGWSRFGKRSRRRLALRR